MIIDANAYLGRWGLRTTGIWEANEFLELMNRQGIDFSVVTSTTALVTDTREGNRLLAENTSGCERLLPVACVNPVWGLGEARATCENTRFRAVRFSPSTHNYPLTDFSLMDPYMEWAASARLVVYVTVDICYGWADMSGKMGFGPPVYPIREVLAFAEHYAGTPIVVSGYNALKAYERNTLLLPALERLDSLYVETSMFWRAGLIEEIAGKVGSANLLLGTASAINYAAGPLGTVQRGALAQEDKDNILYRNALRLFNIEGREHGG